MIYNSNIMTYKSIMWIYNTGDYMKRNVNYLDMTCYLSPRPFGERVRERGCLAASLLSRLAAFTLAEGATHVAHNNSRKIAFTLAEVLITLGIIGVVAAMTMPSLIQNYQEKATVTRVKKVYNVLSTALQSAYFENGKYNENENVNDSGQTFYEYISPYLKFQKYCGTEKGCWPDVTIKHLHGENWANLDSYQNYIKAILADGTLFQFYRNGEIRVDVNGFKGPNTVGRDIFYFAIKDDKVIPIGLQNEKVDSDGADKFNKYCNISSSIDYNGIACTGWVITNENMDYLHCDDLSWDGKHSCKEKSRK